jgi:hypothetical protein
MIIRVTTRLGLVHDTIDPADQAKVIDIVNRLNLAFDRYDIEAMIEVFTEDCELEHPYGTVKGHAELRRFYDAYRPLTIGVRRHNTNHVVDAGNAGMLTVTSHGVLFRIAPVGEARSGGQRDIVARHDGIPAIFSHALCIDTFRKDPGPGWRIRSRVVEDTTANEALRPELP